MAAIGSIVVLELRLDQDTFVHDFTFYGSDQCKYCVLLLIREVCRALWIFNYANRICLVREYKIDVIAELRVVDEARIANFVFVDQSINLFFTESQVKCAQASAELIKNDIRW